MPDKPTSKIQRLKSFLRENPSEPFLHFALAREYEKLGMEDMALEEYRFLVTHHQDYVGTYYHFGSLLRVTGKEEEAQEVFQLGMFRAQQAGDQHALSELQRIASQGADPFD